MLSERERRTLRGRAQRLRPVVSVGAAGVTPAIEAALEEALVRHALVKIKVRVDSRAGRRETIEAMCAHAGAELVHCIGHVAVLYRPRADRSEAGPSDVADQE